MDAKYNPQVALLSMIGRATEDELMLAVMCMNRNRDFAVKVCDTLIEGVPSFYGPKEGEGKSDITEFMQLLDKIGHWRFEGWSEVSPVPRFLAEQKSAATV